jgi:hypothetical protein
MAFSGFGQCLLPPIEALSASRFAGDAAAKPGIVPYFNF